MSECSFILINWCDGYAEIWHLSSSVQHDISRVRYRFEHEKIILYLQATMYYFINIRITKFVTIFRRSPNNLWMLSEGHMNILRTFPKISEDCQGKSDSKLAMLVSKRDVIDIFTGNTIIFTCDDTTFLSGENPCKTLVYIINIFTLW